MNVAAVHDQIACERVLRDRRGIVVGRIEHQRLTGKSIARDARGHVIGSYNPREGLTRDVSGKVVAKGNLLAGMLIQPW